MAAPAIRQVPDCATLMRSCSAQIDGQYEEASAAIAMAPLGDATQAAIASARRRTKVRLFLPKLINRLRRIAGRRRQP